MPVIKSPTEPGAAAAREGRRLWTLERKAEIELKAEYAETDEKA
ncbi:MAG TPA: hypothetical protein VFP79_10995 [Pseudolabrys sp.]|jgi:hypothetical protein|nr:hypothetical protein [Pseudolabrys sp.]